MNCSSSSRRKYLICNDVAPLNKSCFACKTKHLRISIGHPRISWQIWLAQWLERKQIYFFIQQNKDWKLSFYLFCLITILNNLTETTSIHLNHNWAQQRFCGFHSLGKQKLVRDVVSSKWLNYTSENYLSSISFKFKRSPFEHCELGNLGIVLLFLRHPLAKFTLVVPISS